MGFNTHFQPENIGAPLYNYGFHKIQRHTKSIIVEMLKNYFSTLVSSYKLTIPEITSVYNTSEIDKLFILPDFPYTERKLPLIVISIKDIKEKKMYMGADNIIGYKVVGTSSGRRTVEVYGGANTVSVNISIVALSSEDRMKLAELIEICFTHYYRWQYFYSLNDGTFFNIVPNSTTVAFTGETETKEPSKTNMLYITNMSMTSFVEYSFTGLERTGTLETIEYDTSSGPIHIPFEDA